MAGIPSREAARAMRARSSPAATHPDRAAKRRGDGWIHARLVGWGLIGVWQLLAIAADWIPLGLERPFVRLTGQVLNLIGLGLVAIGYERLVARARESGRADGR